MSQEGDRTQPCPFGGYGRLRVTREGAYIRIDDPDSRLALLVPAEESALLNWQAGLSEVGATGSSFPLPGRLVPVT